MARYLIERLIIKVRDGEAHDNPRYWDYARLLDVEDAVCLGPVERLDFPNEVTDAVD